MKTKIKSLDQNLRIDLSSHILSFAGRFDTGKLCVSFELMTAEEKERGGGDKERERERESGGAIVVDRIGVATKYNEKQVACSLLEPKRFKAKRSAEP